MENYFNESEIAATNKTNFVIEKVTKDKSATETITFSMFKYKTDALHCKENIVGPGKKIAGDGDSLGWDLTSDQYDSATWGDVLYLGLYLGCAPDYIYNNKSVTSIDVIENDQQIIDYVDWINSNITVIQGDEWNYVPHSKNYDIIICDLWALPSDITQDHKTNLANHYTSYLKTGGKIIIPITGETIS
tara:strand:+ start:3871 stop:4437 length:567 start_codon:yes stop_codon:yes gene_type:complete